MSGPFKMKGYSYPGTSPVKVIKTGVKGIKSLIKLGKDALSKTKKPKVLMRISTDAKTGKTDTSYVRRKTITFKEFMN
tara:strand:+ start:460 stop:693 length:234 start_codon:yes stop_codon:yes gene_type:complete